MAEVPETPIPPYPSFSTFTNFISSLSKSDVPNRIDKTLFPKLSGGAQSSLLGALKYLNLIREDGAPQPELSQLVHATEAERAKILAKVLRGGYRFVFTEGFDLGKATPGELSERFKAAKAGGGTLEKSISFFLAAAKAASIPISPHIMQQKHAKNANAPKRQRRQTADKRNSKREDPPGEDPPNPAAKTFAQTLYDMLDPTGMKKEEQDAIWTLLRYLKAKEGKGGKSA